MIQRLQHLFFALIALSMVVSLFIPFWHKTNVAGTQQITLSASSLSIAKLAPDGDAASVVSAQSTIYIGILAILAASVSIYIITQYNNRKRQMLFCSINGLLLAGVAGSVFFSITTGNNLLEPMYPNAGVNDFAWYIPIGALLLNMVSNRMIRRDEDLVRSADRIR